ncbi:HNH endonuclease signature motif containing protein [Sphingomonas sp.]|uniref:HNH endonuclease n=1 Tax=Sphingomonas sp. TaxID=28214 RepID=UPI0017AB6809|nr:HNH endonuclease signature motif containing protein [Sphingomonas sp.]MBA3512413.1 HNH endonuclease [Sphingomonas sp.]
MIAAHPLEKKPYNAIKFARVDGNDTPLYTVGKSKKELGAAAALRSAFQQFGGHCFHCKQWMPPERLSHDRTRDHVRAKHNGGRDFLHNLVLACGPCNRSKGGADLISFRPEIGSEYMKALDEHLVKCLKSLGSK